MTRQLATSRFLLNVATWAQETASPNAGAGNAGAVGSLWMRNGAYPTRPTEMYLKLNSTNTGWVKQNTVNVNVYNVQAFGALGDGVNNDLTAINNAVSAAVAAGGGIIYFPRTANFYNVQKANVAGKPDLIPINNHTDLTFLGDGFASKIKQTGSVFGGESHMFGIHNNSKRIKFLNLYIEVDQITNQDPSAQNHGIEVYGIAGEGAGGSDVDICGCYFGRFVGDAVRILGENSAVVDNVRVIYNMFDLFNGTIGSRSATEAQRSTTRIQIHSNWMTGSHDQEIDFEATAGPGPDAWSILHNHIDHRNSAAGCLTLSGSGTAQPTIRTECSFNTITNGGDISGISLVSCEIVGNIVTKSSNDTTGFPVLGFQQNANQLVIRSNVAVSLNTVASRPGISLTLREGQMPSYDIISDNVVETQGVDPASATGIIANDSQGDLFEGNIVNVNTTAGNSCVGINVTAADTNISDVMMNGNLVISQNAALLIGCNFAASPKNMSTLQSNYNFVGNAFNIVRWATGGIGVFTGPKIANCNAGRDITGNSLSYPGDNTGATIEGTGGPGCQVAGLNLAAGPSGNVSAPVGSMALNLGGGQASTLFTKESGVGVSGGSAGWMAFGPTEIVMGALDITASGADKFLAPGGLGLALASDTEIQFAMTRPGTIRNLRLKCTAGQTNEVNTYTVRKNGVDTAVSLVIANTSTSATGAGSFTVVAGDLISAKVSKTSAPLSGQKNVCLSFELV